jgi:hypothetical protein
MNDDKEFNPMVRYLIVGFIIAFFIVAIFLSGAFYSCKKSNGVLTKGYKCVGVEIVKACEINNVPYIEKVTLYRELNSDGSFGNLTYVGGFPNGS